MKHPPRILIVDDDPEIGRMLSRALSRHGFEVDALTSAREALGKAEATPYDAAVVDLVMPGMDAPRACPSASSPDTRTPRSSPATRPPAPASSPSR
jgi:DNA-binding response OmpR family regulator